MQLVDGGGGLGDWNVAKRVGRAEPDKPRLIPVRLREIEEKPGLMVIKPVIEPAGAWREMNHRAIGRASIVHRRENTALIKDVLSRAVVDDAPILPLERDRLIQIDNNRWPQHTPHPVDRHIGPRAQNRSIERPRLDNLAAWGCRSHLEV